MGDSRDLARAHRRPEGEAGCVLLVDDEESMRHFLRRALLKAGFGVQVARDALGALAILKEKPIDVLVTDIRMPGMDGETLLQEAAALSPGTVTILMTAFGSIKSAVLAVRAGAENYLAKPFETSEFLLVVTRAVEKARLRSENRMLRALLKGRGAFAGMVGASRAMRRLYSTLERVARQEGTVLISGEHGTGKELVARAVHALSPRHEGPFVGVHCGALPRDLLGAELFGVEEGAFTGAKEGRPGYIERALGGTLFLDEVGEIPLAMQPTLLGFLERREVSRLGGGKARIMDVRVVAATHCDLWKLVREGRFREDLVFRLNVLPIEVPPLHKRPDDIPLLVRHFLQQAGRPELLLPPHVLLALQNFSFPGNVRELRNLVERLASLVEGERVELEDLPPEILSHQPPPNPLTSKPYRQALEAFERDYLEKLLRETGGNVSEAARKSGLSRPGLHARIASLEIDVRAFRSRNS